MSTLRKILVVAALAVAGAAPVIGQVHKYFTPGTVWTVTMIRVSPGMDQTYLEYLDGQSLAQALSADGGAWNLLILREFTSLSALESNVEKSDALAQQVQGSDQVQQQGYQDRSKYREVVGTKYAREIILK